LATIVVLIVRLLLGLLFLVFGLNAFLEFLKGPIPGGLAGQLLQGCLSQLLRFGARTARSCLRIDGNKKGGPLRGRCR
jgi:hypothetical protein